MAGKKTDEAHPEGFDYIKDVICPPAQSAKTGRLNNEGMPVLYASISNHGCLAEIGAVPGDKVQVSAFDLKPEQNCTVALSVTLLKRTNGIVKILLSSRKHWNHLLKSKKPVFS